MATEVIPVYARFYNGAASRPPAFSGEFKYAKMAANSSVWSAETQKDDYYSDTAGLYISCDTVLGTDTTWSAAELIRFYYKIPQIEAPYEVCCKVGKLPTGIRVVRFYNPPYSPASAWGHSELGSPDIILNWVDKQTTIGGQHVTYSFAVSLSPVTVNTVHKPVALIFHQRYSLP